MKKNKNPNDNLWIIFTAMFLVLVGCIGYYLYDAKRTSNYFEVTPLSKDYFREGVYER